MSTSEKNILHFTLQCRDCGIRLVLGSCREVLYYYFHLCITVVTLLYSATISAPNQGLCILHHLHNKVIKKKKGEALMHERVLKYDS